MLGHDMTTFGIGAVLATTFRVIARNAVALAVVAIVVYLPALVLGLTAPEREHALSRIVVGWLLDATASALITYAVIMELRGTRPSYRACASVGISRFRAAYRVALLSLLAIAGGFVLLIVPGVVIAMMLFVAVPVAVMEGPGVRASLRRSRYLTDGHKGEIAIVVIVLGAINYGAREVLADILPGDAGAVVTVTIEALKGVVTAVAAAVAYAALRAEREGTQLPEVAPAVASIRSRT